MNMTVTYIYPETKDGFKMKMDDFYNFDENEFDYMETDAEEEEMEELSNYMDSLMLTKQTLQPTKRA